MAEEAESGTEQKTYLNQKDYDAHVASQGAGGDTTAPTEQQPTTNTEATTEAAQPDFASLVQKEYGFTPDQLKERIIGYDNLVQEKERINSEFEQYKAKPTYLTESGKKIDEYLSRGVQLSTIAKFDGLDVDALSPEGRIKLKMEIEHPEWKPEHIDAYYNSLYATDPDSINPADNTLKEAKLLEDDRKSADFLKSYIGEKLNPATPAATPATDAENKIQALKGEWQGKMSTLTGKMQELSHNVSAKTWTAKGEEAAQSTFNLPIPENDRSAIWSMAVNTAIGQGITPTAEGIQQVEGLANQIAWSLYGPQLLDAAVNAKAAEMIAAFKQTIHAPAAVGSQGDANQGTAEKTREDAWRNK